LRSRTGNNRGFTRVCTGEGDTLEVIKEHVMNRTTHTHIRRLAAGLLVLVALGVAACGSNSSSSTSSSSSSAAPTATQSSSPSGGAAATTSSSSGASAGGIPQGANAGDGDADNRGGPSDGDGNL
jgi:hypothetical protein